MKRALHVLIPLLLSVLIVISIGWYLLEYDPAFTRDLLLSQARYQDKVGNHAAAVWFYGLAYRQSDNDDAVALELAEQYLAAGNYTKAEYTLSNAIADGGSIDLYITLCRTYVEQDKLLDAVTMLNNIADPQIKAQLDAIRPAAPTPSCPVGNYTQYISLEFSAEDGVCYISDDREYPSLEKDRYTDAISLGAGESVLYGLTVGENGLVSTLGVYSYIVQGIIEPVQFADAGFEDAVRALLGVDEAHTVYTNELWDITEFSVPASVSDYTDLQWLPSLQTLEISEGSFTTLQALTQLTQLQTVRITKSVVSSSDLSVLASLPKLTVLTLNDCQLSSITELSGATALTELDLGNNTVRDLAPLRGMKSLHTLNLQHNAVIDLGVLSELTALRELDVSYNSLLSVAPLASLYELRVLDISHNELTTLNGLDKLTGLTELSASYNQLVGINELSNCTELVKLDVSGNTLLSIDPVAGMLSLSELDFSHNEVSALPEFSTSCALWTVRGEYNQLQSLAPLAGLTELSYIYMDHNEAISSVDCLQTCSMLVLVSVYGSAVSDVQVLKDMSVKVYYDPT